MRKFILTLVGCSLFAGTLMAENTDTVYCYYNKRGTVSTGSDWKEVTKGEIEPNSATFGVSRTYVQEANFVAHPPAGHTVTGWYWNENLDSITRGMSVLTSTSDPNLTMAVAEDGQSCKATLKVSTVPSSVRRALGAYFDYLPLTVTFNGNGSTSGSTASITGKNIDSSFSLTANGFTKTGYTFSNWTNDRGATFDNSASVKGNSFWDSTTWTFHSALTAQWTPNTYTVTFNGNGGSTPSSKSVTYDSTYGELPSSTQAGYTFAGWFTDASGGTEVKSDTKVKIIKDQTLYAHWTSNGYTVTFDANGGGTPSPATTSVTYGSTYGSLATCSREGYSFDGWYTEKSGGTKIETTTTVSITDAQTLYAHWTPISYTITYNGLKQGVTHSNPLSYTIESETITFSAPSEAAGYKFSGWSPASIEKGSTGNKSVTAQYLSIAYKPDVSSPKTYNGYSQTCAQPGTGVVAKGNQAKDVGTYTATFTPISGYCWSDGTVAPYVVEWEITAAKITDATVAQTGYLTYTGEPQRPTVHTSATIIGSQPTWKYSKTSGGYVEQLPEFTDAGDYTVYFEISAPNYEPAYGSFTVTVKRARETTAVVSPTHLPYTKKEQGPTVTLKHCHETAGSVKRATDIGTYAVKVEPDANYAWSDGETSAREFGWSIDDSLYTVQFDRNGGAGEMVSTNLAYNEEYVVPECLFTKTGCEFQSWLVLIDNRTVTNYPAGTVVSNLTTTAGKVVTFKADWLGRYTIAFDANGGEGTMASTNVERNVGFLLPSNAFTRTGYDFTTWTTNLSASAKPADLIADGATVTNLVAAGETCTLHALWNAHHYTVTFDANGGTGSVPEDMEFTYGVAQQLPETPIPTEPLHYEFTGWGTDPMQKDGTYQPNESVSNLTAVADGQVTLYAIWKFIESSISEALDIDSHDLYFENGSRMVTPWSIDYERYCREDTSASSMLHLGDNGQIVATAKSAGTLSFWWMGEFEEDPWTGEQEKQTTLLVECNGGTMTNNCVESFNMEWQKVEIRILAPSDITFSHSGTSRCWVDHVVWTPDGGGEPTRGDPVAVTAADITDGVFALTIPTVSGTDYGVWTNADLTVDSWGLMGEPQKGEGDPLEFKWTILPGFPQLFFRAHKVEYK